MTCEEIEIEIIRLISPMFPELDTTITVDTDLVDIGFDSLCIIELFVGIEKKFNLQLIDLGISEKDLKSIKSLASFIKNQLG